MSQLETPPVRDPLAALKIDRSAQSSQASLVRKLLKWLVVLVLIGGVGWGGILVADRQGWFSFADMLRQRTEVQVEIVQVETGRAGDAVVVATGYLESRRQAKIGAKSAGRIQTINVDEGDTVIANKILAVLEHADIDAAMAATVAMSNRAKAELAEQEIQIA